MAFEELDPEHVLLYRFGLTAALLTSASLLVGTGTPLLALAAVLFTRHVYRPDPAGLEPLRAYVESLWHVVLEAFARADDGADEGTEETRQEVEVMFHPEGQGTRVELVHTGWERIPEEPREMRDGCDSGWDVVLGRFVEA